MELEFLGTGAGQPSRQRNVSSIALRLLNEQNQVWLFDVGEATQHQLLKSNIRSRKITKIFITHMHGDHIFGLPGFLASRNFQASDVVNNGKPSDLDIYGPRAIRPFVMCFLKNAQIHLDYHINFFHAHPGLIYRNRFFAVRAFKMNHGIEDYAYRVVEKNTAGRLQVNKLLKLGLKPGPLFGKLKSGQTVRLNNGDLINGKDFLGPAEPGRIVTIVMDTKETPEIVKAAKNADVLVHEATYDGNNQLMARNHNHSTCIEAAHHATDANARKLILTHISARYVGREAKLLVKQARRIFPNTKIAKDMEVFNIPSKKGQLN